MIYSIERDEVNLLSINTVIVVIALLKYESKLNFWKNYQL